MPALVDMVGKTFGRLEVIQRGSGTKWMCLCSCGNYTEVEGGSLRAKRTRSCGCLHKDVMSAGKFNTIHSFSGTPEYSVWCGMKTRCNNPSSDQYKYYGGRGISVSERWGKFENFLDDMGRIPEGCSLERIDNDGNYEPGNVRWATRVEQANNKRSNVILKHNGRSATLMQWSRHTGISEGTIRDRLKRCWTIEKTLTTPVRIAA